MAHTNSWDESTPVGTEDAKTLDNYQRKHRLDLGERLEDLLYGFNASSNTAPENNYGVKSLRFYKQSSDPTQTTDYGHFYVKLVSGVPELFYQDDTNITLQLTSGGKLYSSGALKVAGASTLTGNVACSGTLDVTGNIDPTTYETTNGGFLDEDAMGSDSANKVASQQSIKAYADTKEEALVTQATASIFGSWTTLDSDAGTLAKDEDYKVGSDGFVIAWQVAQEDLKFFTDGSNPPTTELQGAGADVREIMRPVRKDDYWKITSGQATVTIYWLPIGTGGCVKQ